MVQLAQVPVSVLESQVPVQVPVLESRVPVPVPESQVQVPVLESRVPVQVPVPVLENGSEVRLKYQYKYPVL